MLTETIDLDAMSRVYERRRANLLRLTERHSITRIARAAGLKSASMLSQCLMAPPRRTLGERLARKIEAAMQLAPGWLDRKPPAVEPAE